MVNVCGCCKISGIFPPSAFAAKNSGLLIAAVIIIDVWLYVEGCVTVTSAKVGCKSLDVIKSILSIFLVYFFAELLKDPNLLEELCVAL